MGHLTLLDGKIASSFRSFILNDARIRDYVLNGIRFECEVVLLTMSMSIRNSSFGSILRH